MCTNSLSLDIICHGSDSYSSQIPPLGDCDSQQAVSYIFYILKWERAQISLKSEPLLLRKAQAKGGVVSVLQKRTSTSISLPDTLVHFNIYIVRSDGPPSSSLKKTTDRVPTPDIDEEEYVNISLCNTHATYEQPLGQICQFNSM